MVGPPHGDHLGASREALGQLEGPLDRLRARVDEVDALESPGQQRGDARGILHLRRLDQLAVDHHVHVACGLLLHGAHDGRIRMADVAHRDARHQVVIAFALGRIEERALGVRHLDEHRRGRRLGHMAEKLFAQNRIHIG